MQWQLALGPLAVMQKPDPVLFVIISMAPISACEKLHIDCSHLAVWRFCSRQIWCSLPSPAMQPSVFVTMTSRRSLSVQIFAEMLRLKSLRNCSGGSVSALCWLWVCLCCAGCGCAYAVLSLQGQQALGLLAVMQQADLAFAVISRNAATSAGDWLRNGGRHSTFWHSCRRLI